MRALPLAVLAAVVLTAGCAAVPAEFDEQLDTLRSELTTSERRSRAGVIRDRALARGIQTGWLVAGVADAETQMSHCHRELTWACRGPASSSCGGGPVVAGSGDGPCSRRQGGLGTFQFDAGTYDDTLRREGSRILSLEGNIDAGIDFLVAIVERSPYISGVSSEADAIAWMNGVGTSGARFDAWVRTVTHLYNGCRPSYGCYGSRSARYRSHALGVRSEMGADFWTSGGGGGGAGDSACARSGGTCADNTANTCSSGFTSGLCPGGNEIQCCTGTLTPIGGGEGASCAHSYGGTYADRACSAGYQCCDGTWATRESCGACTCVETTGRTGCAPAPPGDPCTHSFGGRYGHLACSGGYQCCDGRWGTRESCGACACVEVTGRAGCGT